MAEDMDDKSGETGNATSATGTCACGAVKYEAQGDSSKAGICHCSQCRRFTGGLAFAYQSNSVKLTGESHIRWWQSSGWGERGTCSKCGTAMFWRLRGKEDTWVVYVGSLDDPSGTSLELQIYVDDKPGYYDVEGGTERLTGREFTDRVFSEMKMPVRLIAKAMTFLAGLKKKPEPEQPPEGGPWRGRCNCGTVKVTAKDRPGELVVCHCDTCRRSHGGVAGFWVPLGDVSFEGEESISWWADGKGRERAFCVNCGTTVALRGQGEGKVRVAAAMFEPNPHLETLTFEHPDGAPSDFKVTTPGDTGAQA